MNQVAKLIEQLLQEAEATDIAFANEAELQHEVGYWLRVQLPKNFRIYFERPVHSFIANARNFAKKEIDLVVSDSDLGTLLAIELKCPRSGRVPETMFDACRDMQMLEQLVAAGFCGGLFLMHVNSQTFYQSGMSTGIYSYFRAGACLQGSIQKPTGRKDEVVPLGNAYSVSWQPSGPSSRFWLQGVGATPERARNLA